MRRTFASAFSLVEVVVAIGIFAFAIIMVFGLLPAGILSIRKSVGEVDATQLIERVEQDIRNGYGTTSPIYQIPLTTSGSNTLFFDRSLGRVTSAAAGYYRVDCRIASAAPVLSVNLRATWPAVAGITNAEGSSETTTSVFIQPRRL